MMIVEVTDVSGDTIWVNLDQMCTFKIETNLEMAKRYGYSVLGFTYGIHKLNEISTKNIERILERQLEYLPYGRTK